MANYDRSRVQGVITRSPSGVRVIKRLYKVAIGSDEPKSSLWCVQRDLQIANYCRSIAGIENVHDVFMEDEKLCVIKVNQRSTSIFFK